MQGYRNVIPISRGYKPQKKQVIHGKILDAPLTHRSRLRIQRDGIIYTVETRSNLGYCASVIGDVAKQQQILDELGYSIHKICSGELLSIEILDEAVVASIA